MTHPKNASIVFSFDLVHDRLRFLAFRIDLDDRALKIYDIIEFEPDCNLLKYVVNIVHRAQQIIRQNGHQAGDGKIWMQNPDRSYSELPEGKFEATNALHKRIQATLPEEVAA